MEKESQMVFMDIPTEPKSPMTPSPRRDKGHHFFDILTRRFARRSHDDLCYQQTADDDTRSSSTESCSSASDTMGPQSKTHCSNLEISYSSDSSNSSNTSTGDRNINNRHQRSLSSLRRVMQNLSISSRSISCGGALQQTGNSSSTSPKKNKKKEPKRILRQPVSYTYLKGMSGLPTQRVPRSLVCCQYSHR